LLQAEPTVPSSSSNRSKFAMFGQQHVEKQETCMEQKQCAAHSPMTHVCDPCIIGVCDTAASGVGTTHGVSRPCSRRWAAGGMPAALLTSPWWTW
jgi:hypothetical protein